MAPRQQAEVEQKPQSVGDKLASALQVLEAEHSVIRSMMTSESHLRDLSKLRRGIVKPYQDAARVASKDLRVKMATLNSSIDAAEKPTFDKMATDSIEVNGESMTIAKRLELIAQQSTTERTSYKDAKAKLYAVAGPINGQ